LFLGNQFPAEHSLCEEVTVLPRQGMEGTAVKKRDISTDTDILCDETAVLMIRKIQTM
jgi:hypothetical protein